MVNIKRCIGEKEDQIQEHNIGYDGKPANYYHAEGGSRGLAAIPAKVRVSEVS